MFSIGFDGFPASSVGSHVSMAWYCNSSTVITRATEDVLNAEAAHPEIDHTDWGLMYSWSEVGVLTLPSGDWLQYGASETKGRITYAVVVVEHETGASVFVASPLDAATHLVGALLRRQLKSKHRIGLDPAPLTISSDGLLAIVSENKALKILGLKTFSTRTLAVSVFPTLSDEGMASALINLGSNEQIVAVMLEVAGLRVVLQPTNRAGGEPVLVMEPRASKQGLAEVARRIAAAFGSS